METPSRLEILCIEDFPLDAQLLDELLGSVASFYYQFSWTLRIDEALNLLSKHHFDVVLLDLQALGQAGLDAISLINDVPVIAVTDKRQESQAIESIQYGVRQFFIKGEIDGPLLVRALINARQPSERLCLVTPQDYKESFLKLFRDTADAAFIIDIGSGMVLDANASAELLFGYTADVIHHGQLNFLQLWKNPGEWAVVRALLHLGKPCTRQRWTMLTASQAEVHVLASFDILSVDKRPCVLAVCTDRTECEDMRTHLAQAQKGEAIGTLVGGIAHDFNNILAIITGYADLIASNENLDDEAISDLANLQKGCQRARELVQQIHAFSRQTSQEKQPIQISHIIKETLKLLRASLPSTIRIVQEVMAEGYILADITQIRQVFLNLCTDAYKAMGEAGSLYVALEDVEYAEVPAAERNNMAESLQVRIIVRGECPAMEHLEVETEPFSSTILDIVREHNGNAYLQKVDGGCMEAHLYFPAISQQPGAVRTDLSDIEITPCHVMLVDDEKALLEVYSKLLSRLGYRVYTFTSAASALNALENNPQSFDVLFTDLTMPAITGIQLIQIAKRRFPDLPAILCTGYSEMIDHIDTAALGIRRILKKPLIVREMVLAIEESLEKA